MSAITAIRSLLAALATAFESLAATDAYPKLTPLFHALPVVLLATLNLMRRAATPERGPVETILPPRSR